MEEAPAITFEAIYDLVRKEKTTEEIQKLSPQIYNQLIEYLRAKIEIYKNAKANSQKDADTLKIQINSARKLIKELYERRERKILQLALNKSRTSSDIITETGLLENEKELFRHIEKILSSHRKDILLNLINAKLPGAHEKKQENDSLIMIRFTSAVPKFLGINLETLGPFMEGDIANLPKEITDILIKKERAQEIKPEL